MSTQHTPGPWKFAHDRNDLIVHDGDDVAYVDTLIPERPKAEQRANARLIAAAPELLEAARIALAESERANAHFGMDTSPATMALRAAIAKATGTK